MANVNITIALQGMQQVTAGLKAITGQLNALGNQANLNFAKGMGTQFRAMGVQAGYAAQGLAAAQRNMATLQRTATPAVTTMGRLQTAFAGLQSHIGNLSTGFSNMGANFARFQQRALVSAAFFGLIGAAAAKLYGGILKVADSYTQLQARLNIVSTDAADNAKQLSTIYKIAQEVRLPLEAVGKTYTRIALSGEHLGLSQEQVASITRTLSESLQLSGSTAEEAANGMIQLTQAMSKGKLDGDELRSVFENMPLVVKALEESTGRYRGELYKLASQGRITADVWIGAVLKAGMKTHELFKMMPLTFEQAGTVMQNAFMRAVGGANAGQGAVRGFTDAMGEITRIIETPAFASGLYEFLTKSAKFFVALAKDAHAFWDEIQIQITAYEALKLTQGDGMRGAKMLWDNVLGATKENVKALKEYIALRGQELAMQEGGTGVWNDYTSAVDKGTTSVAKWGGWITTVTKEEKEFTGALGEAADALGKKTRALTLTNNALQAQIDGNQALARELTIQARIETEATDQKTGAVDQAAAAQIRLNDALSRGATMSETLRGHYAKLKDALEDIAEQERLNAESAGKYGMDANKAAVARMGLAQQELQAWTGVGTALTELQSVSQNVFGAFSETIASSLTDGKSSWSDFFKDLQKQMIKFLISQAVMGLLKLIFTIATGGVGGGLMGLVSGFLGFAKGGKVGISKGESSNLIGMINNGDGTFSDSALGGNLVKFAKGGPVGTNPLSGLGAQDDKLGESGGRVPGKGKTDSVKALLTPGEYVINALSASKNLKTLEAINASKGVASLTAIKKSLDTDTKSDAQASSIQKMYDALPKKTQKKMRGVSNFSTFLGFASGGRIGGVGHRDTIPAMLTPGEFVINKKATRRHSQLLHEINADRMATGGVVGGGKPTWSRSGDNGTTIIFSGITAIDEIGVARLERRLTKRSALADYRRYGVTS